CCVGRVEAGAGLAGVDLTGADLTGVEVKGSRTVASRTVMIGSFRSCLGQFLAAARACVGVRRRASVSLAVEAAPVDGGVA
nr:hypothetical protein [Micromonospora sp. DSM 115978]